MGYFSTLSEILSRRTFNDTRYKTIDDITLVTIDRQEARLSNKYATLVVTVPNNEQKIEADFRNALDTCMAKGSMVGDVQLIIIPTDSYGYGKQADFETTSNAIAKQLKGLEFKNVVTTAKSDLIEPSNGLLRYIYHNVGKMPKKALNCYSIEERDLEDERLKKTIKADHIEILN